MAFEYSYEDLAEVLDDPVEFCKRLSIKLTDGSYVPFGDVMTEEQIRIIRTVTDPNITRIAIAKARQMGITTAVRAACFWATYTSPDSSICGIAGPIKETADEIIEMDRTFYRELPKPFQRVCKERAGELSFPTTRSKIRTFSSDNRGGLRGWTFSYNHLTEYAFYRKPQDFLASVEANTADGTIILESTPNHWDDALHQIVKKKDYEEDEDIGWEVIFLSWATYPKYRIDTPEDFVMTPREAELSDKHDLSPEQVYWRRSKIASFNGDEKRFRREYPLTLEEAYSLSDDNYFGNQHFEHLGKIEIEKATVLKLVDFDRDDSYVMGVDVAGGQGQDYSCGTIIARSTNSPVAFVYSNKLSVSDFAQACMNLASLYRGCVIAFEGNNHGAGFKEVLNSYRFTNYTEWTTTTKSKLQLYAVLREHLEQNMIAYLDKLTYNEMRSLVRDEKGLAPKHPDGLHDDRVIAYAIALYHIKDLPMPMSDWDKTLYKLRQRDKVMTPKPAAKPHNPPRLRHKRRR